MHGQNILEKVFCKWPKSIGAASAAERFKKNPSKNLAYKAWPQRIFFSKIIDERMFNLIHKMKHCATCIHQDSRPEERICVECVPFNEWNNWKLYDIYENYPKKLSSKKTIKKKVKKKGKK